ncbi:MAG: asparagine synthase (glutamine-hydrolyzing) [Betaproteobacteria bacterium]|nr:asparagine synthase (glutamine-hydrolyzing) [Betaproteobacteria bacterium]
MCGIFGHVGSISRELAEHCLTTLTHRGPDGAGLWQAPGVTLGHRRLAILDLSENGRQPMSDPEGRYWITFNGEIYNFLEVRAELAAKGHRFRSESDTEVILAAYREWGEACLPRFNGMWAFAIWDSRERTLFLARDRFGKKPLFYARLPDGGFAFASEMKALLPLLPDARPDQALVRGMSPRASFAYEATDRCLVAGIQRLLAGHSGTLREGRLTMRRWWNTLDHLPEVPARYEEQVEQLRSLLLDACRLRMRSDVTIGTALSGGLDSSAVFSMLAHINRTQGGEARLSNDWQHAIVASFPGTPLDEAAFARQVAQHVGSDVQVLEIDPMRYLHDLPRMLYLYEDLTVTSPLPFMALYGRIKQAGVTVTLDGHAADELFGGYPTDWAYALLDAGLDIAQINQVLEVYEGGTPEGSAQFKRPGNRFASYARRMGSTLAKLGLGMQSNLGPEYTQHPRWRELDHLSRALFWQTHSFVLPTILRSYDRYGMSASVEIRMPFLDWRVATFAMALPWQSKIRNGFSKAIVRDAAAPFMPHEITYRRTKIGFNSPIVDWMRGPLRGYFLDTLASRRFRECSLVDPARAQRLVTHVIDDPRASFKSGEQAWWSVLPFLWSEALFAREPHAPHAPPSPPAPPDVARAAQMQAA